MSRHCKSSVCNLALCTVDAVIENTCSKFEFTSFTAFTGKKSLNVIAYFRSSRVL